MIISRVFSHPNKHTFKMTHVKKLLTRYNAGRGWIDPFCGESNIAEFRNDLNPKNIYAQEHKTAKEYCSNIKGSFVGVLFDPPYSEEQCLRKYSPKFKGTAGRAEYWGKCKDEISRIISHGGLAISFCWDSCGMGVGRGFKIKEILLVCHGACHNDTIVTVERKIQSTLALTEGKER